MTTKELITGRTVIAFDEEPDCDGEGWYRLTLDNGMMLLVQAGWVWVFPEED